MKRRHLLGYGASLSALAVAAGGGVKRAFAQAATAAKSLAITPEMRAKYLAEIAARKEQPIQKRMPRELTQDPWSKPITRGPVTEDVDVLIVGTGWAGLLSAVRLVEKGVTNIRLVDKSGDFGGTWYWNRYPGASCDDMSIIYMPLLEETGYLPTEHYAHQWEIFEQAQRIGKKYDLYKKTLFQTRLNGVTWNEKTSRWESQTDRGDKIRARFVITGTGPLDTPKYPGIPGVETFAGAKWHTSRWNYDYTGGSNKGELTKLAGKRVGVIGTGATGIQCIPHLAKYAKEFYVFQRTPSETDERNNGPIPKDFLAKQKPGWHQRWMINFSLANAGELPDAEEFLIRDGFTKASIMQRDLKKQHPELSPADLAEAVDFQIQEGIRKRIDNIVKDKKTAEELKPYYKHGCKRPTFSDEYYQAYNLPQTKLCHDPKGPERVTPKGVVFHGKEIELDALVFSSGFEFTTPLVDRQGFDYTGKGGLKLSEYWKDGALTYHGIHIRNFPNLFIQSNIQFGVGGNHQQQSEYSARTFAYMIKECMDKKINTIEPSQEAQDKWVDVIVTGGARDTTSTFVGQIAGEDNRIGCPGAQRGSGEAEISPVAAKRNGSFRGGLNEIMKILDEWVAKGGMEGLEQTKFNA